MKTKNKYRKGARLDNFTTEKIIDCFVEDIQAVKVGKILQINRKTIDNWYLYFREIIYEECKNRKQEKLGGGIYELDESYFGPTRIKGKRGRGAGGKTIVFGLLKRDGEVYTEIVSDAKAKSLIPIIRGKIDPGSENKYRWMESIFRTCGNGIGEALPSTPWRKGICKMKTTY